MKPLAPKTIAEAKHLVAVTMSEAVFQARVIALAADFGWAYYHTHDSRRSNAGFPDLVLWSTLRKRVIYVELKGYDQNGRLGTFSPAQLRTMSELRQCGQDVRAWIPDDLDRIREVLQG